MPVTVLGVGSNLLVRDGGIRGVVIRLMRGFTGIAVEGNEVIAGAGALDLNVALTARDHSLTGLEFLSGIPGTIGGAFPTNAGAYGGELAEVLISAEAVDRAGRIRHVDAGRARPVLSAQRRRRPTGSSPRRGCARHRATSSRSRGASPRSIRRGRRSSRAAAPAARPSPTRPTIKAWELIDRRGCRGLTVGGAQVSDKHTNFLINTGAATAADIEGLGEEVRRRVFERNGVLLQWEISRIGERA